MSARAFSLSETVGARLRRLRLERGLSQRELARSGVSYAYISRIEGGTRQPSVKALRKLAAKLGVSAEYLERGSELAWREERELALADAELELRLGSDVAAAEQKLRALLEEALAAGEAALATGARVGLGFAASVAARHAEAIEHLEPIALERALPVSARPDVYSTLGFSYATLGQPERAVALFESCLRELEQEAHTDASGRMRFATLLSYALADLGELDRARETVEHALASAPDASDRYASIRLYWSLARLASMQGDQLSALANARKALVLLEQTEDTLHLARAHLLCGSILVLQGQPEPAGPHFVQAERLFGPHPDKADLASLRTEQAKRAAALAEGAAAVALARESLELLADQDPAEQGGARWALAEGLALEGAVDDALVEFQQATDLLAEHRRWRDLRVAADAWARTLRQAGREREAETVAERYAHLRKPRARAR